MAIDRSKFRKSSASQMVQADKELNKTMGKKDRSNGHDIDEGTNLFRAYPVHPDIAEKDPNAVFAQPFVQAYLPAMVPEYSADKKPILEADGKPKLKVGSKPVYNSKVHGKTKKDLVEEYIALVNKNAKDLGLNEADRKEYVLPIYGLYSEDPKKNVQGINYSQAWIMYADKYPAGNPAATPVFDELRIKKSVKERLNKIAAVEAANDPLGTDPFTDIEEGKAFKILKDSSAVPKTNMYTTEIDGTTVSTIISGKAYKLPKTYPLTDAQLEHFLLQEPLSVKYGKKLATRKNFEAQLAGLEMLDTKWEMGIFELPEWSAIVQECDSYYPENGEVIEDTTDVDTDAQEDLPPTGDAFDLMSRKELQAYAKDNKTGLFIKPSLTDDEIREKLRLWQASATTTIEHVPLPGEQGYVEPAVIASETGSDEVLDEETQQSRQDFINELTGAVPENVVAPPPAENTAAMSAKERLALLRKKQAEAKAAA